MGMRTTSSILKRVINLKVRSNPFLQLNLTHNPFLNIKIFIVVNPGPPPPPPPSPSSLSLLLLSVAAAGLWDPANMDGSALRRTVARVYFSHGRVRRALLAALEVQLERDLTTYSPENTREGEMRHALHTHVQSRRGTALRASGMWMARPRYWRIGSALVCSVDDSVEWERVGEKACAAAAVADAAHANALSSLRFAWFFDDQWVWRETRMRGGRGALM